MRFLNTCDKITYLRTVGEKRDCRWHCLHSVWHVMVTSTPITHMPLQHGFCDMLSIMLCIIKLVLKVVYILFLLISFHPSTP